VSEYIHESVTGTDLWITHHRLFYISFDVLSYELKVSRSTFTLSEPYMFSDTATIRIHVYLRVGIFWTDRYVP